MTYDDNPSVLDRTVAAGIAMLFAIPMGLGVKAIASFAGVKSEILFWTTLLLFATFAFLAPRQSRDFLTKIWHGIIGALRDLRFW